MEELALGHTDAAVFKCRREQLLARFDEPALIVSGSPVPRNYAGNVYRFRATSHFLYFVGKSMERSAVLFRDGEAELFTPEPDAADALWHGARPTLAEQAEALAFSKVRPIEDLQGVLSDVGPVAALPPNDFVTATWLSSTLGRPLIPASGELVDGSDAALADVMVQLRLRHDEMAQARIRETAKVSAAAHCAGMRATKPGKTEAHVVAAMLEVLRSHQLDDAYPPIVTVRGEILHNMAHQHPLNAGDLLLADVGGEHPEGWASDITRTWPVSGHYSATQRAIYDVVLSAQREAIAKVLPTTSYRSIHTTAQRELLRGLVDLGILRGDVDGLLERGAASLFFPHGVGHLLGLDVHDMEDLGDRAGYAPGRQRSPRFGDAFLRLDRDLEPDMVVTIEPGFYQVPAILNDAERCAPIEADLNRDELAKYKDVRGIRIEDDVLCKASGPPEVLTADVPKDASEIESLMRA